MDLRTGARAATPVGAGTLYAAGGSYGSVFAWLALALSLTVFFMLTAYLVGRHQTGA